MKTARLPRFKVRQQLLSLSVAACFSAGAYALPTDPVVVNGMASFNQAGNVLTVTNTNGAIINWQTFGIAAGETTRFVQPSASSAVLNQVVSNNPSALYGTLSSNGAVWLVNQAGILVGAGAVIDTAGFVASTLAVRAEDFLAGRLAFQSAPGAGDVINRGTITTPSGGSVYLVGSNVTNEGLIQTPNGETILAAGQTVELIDTATPGIKVEITGAAGNATNLGAIVADAGRIGIAGAIVRNSGTLDASSVVNEGGRIFLKASQDTYVDGNGRIVATGTTGGQIEVLGNRVAVMDQADIDVSGQTGGGRIMVGGDYQGKNPDIQNASITWFGPEARLKANATEVGDGGTVIVWADDTTRAFGSIEAKGGANGGDGGFVETSGKRYLDFQGLVDTRAILGKSGTLLLDPIDLTISNSADSFYGGSFSGGIFTGVDSPATISWSTINTQLGFGNVVITTNGSNGTGNITIAASPTFANLTVTHTSPYFTSTNTYSNQLYSSSNNLSLLAHNAININAPFGNAGTGAIEMVAGWDGVSTASPAVGAYAAGKSIYFLPAAAMGDVGIVSNGGVTMKAAGEINMVADGAYGRTYIDMTSGALSITTNTLQLYANGDYSSTIRTNGDQTITLAGMGGAGVSQLLLHGSDGVGNQGGYASIERFGGTGGQSFVFNNGAYLTMTGGSGNGTVSGWSGDCGLAGASCSGNYAEIQNYGSGNQTLAFSAGSNLVLQGGGAGNGNDAEINQEGSGAQIISGNPVIQLLGGTGGGQMITVSGEDHYFENSAGISSNGAQAINASSITMTGGNASYGGTYIGGMTQVINVTGNVLLTGGAATLPGSFTASGDFIHENAALIGWDGAGHTLNLTAGSLTLNGGAVNTYGGSPAAIGGYLVPTSTTITTTGGNLQFSSSNVWSDRIGSFGFAGGTLTLNSSGSISLGQGLVGTGSVGSVTMNATAGISQTSSGVIKAASLSAGSSGTQTINLTGENLVANVSLSQTGSGDVYYKSVLPFQATASGGGYIWYKLADTYGYGGDLTLGSHTAGDYIWVEADGSITVNGALNATTSSTHLFAGFDQTGISTLTVNSNITSATNVELDNKEGSISHYGTAAAAAGFVKFKNDYGTTPTGSYIAIDVINHTGTIDPGDDVIIASKGAILDNNGSAINITSINPNQGVYLTSQNGGLSGQLAISTDIRTDAPIDARVLGGNYGGIRITNDGQGSVLSDLYLLDSSANGGPISFSYVGDVDSSSSINISTVAGDIAVMASGSVTEDDNLSFNTPGNTLLGAGGSMTIDCCLSASGSLSLAAGGTLTINGSVDTSGSLSLVAPLIQNDGDVESSSSATLIANDYISNGGSITTWGSTADIIGLIANNMTLENGAYLSAGNDVNLTFAGSTSLLTLTSSFIRADSPDTIYLNFLGLSTGGVMIDGVETTTSSGSSGFFNTFSMIPAELGNGLVITYSNTPFVIEESIKPVDPCLLAPDACKVDTETLASIPTELDQTVGGAEGEFAAGEEGGTTGEAGNDEDKGKGKGRKKFGQCRG